MNMNMNMKTKIVFAIVVLMHVRVFASSGLESDFIAHEWGAFTSVQGADGIQLEWNPLVTSELPTFVYDRGRPSGNARLPRYSEYSGKGALLSFQRMETPVIYFYSGQQRTIDVTVNFPQGTITEWFPQVGKYEPRALRWTGLQVYPQKSNAKLANLLPMDASGSHYFAARETDADFLMVKNNTTKMAEHEKFLFYRGVGDFKAPLQVTLGGNEDTVTLKNNGTETLSHLYVLSLKRGKGKYLHIDSLPPGRQQVVPLLQTRGQTELSDLRPRLAKEMAASLVRDGLFDREASAMVSTWNDSWFGEDGLRVLYTLPRPWTDRILPLTISPAPSGLVRVMVGRAELITPTMEWELMKQVVRYGDPDSKAKEQAVANARAIGLGRFTEPAIRRLVNKMPSREFSQTAWNLLMASAKPVEKKVALAK